MKHLLGRYAHWLHLRWPAGPVEQLPRVRPDFTTGVPGVYVVGDLTGVPLLKFAADSGARAVRRIAEQPRRDEEGVPDVAIVGAGVSGLSAALEAGRLGLSFVVLEADRPLATIEDFPKAKPIFTYPTGMQPAGVLDVRATVREELYDRLRAQTRDVPVHPGRADRVEREAGGLSVVLEDGGRLRARHVVVAIGKSGSYRRLGVPGEEREAVYNRLHDPADFAGQRVLVVGGGDQAAEAAAALAEAGADVTLAHRRAELARPKPENVRRVERLAAEGRLRLLLSTEVEAIEADGVRLRTPGGSLRLENEVVFTMIGREVPLDFFRRSGIEISGDWGAQAAPRWKRVEKAPEPGAAGGLATWADLNWKRIGAMAAFVLLMVCLYNWKGGGRLYELAQRANWFPFNLSPGALDPNGLAGVTVRSAQTPAFWYTLAYSTLIVVFGIRRIRRRRTPYVRAQTLTLAAIQVLPLFLLPEILLPWLGRNEMLPGGLLDALFPVTEWSAHGREYWRAYGLILAWPLFVYNVFTQDPLWGWLAISFAQTFVLIPAMIYFWGKGAYCGWICSCGALAETLGDTHRDKMPHGPGWNRLNLAGQVILALCLLLLLARAVGWIWRGSPFEGFFNGVMYGRPLGVELNYRWVVDTVLAGMIGYGVYFWLSGRVWCRFFCPLAALMHVYARFSRFRIFADKKRCISCNVCTSVCHQGIDVMSFAQRGLPMEDPQCVRCSACVQSCPTAVLSFGQIDRKTGIVATTDQLEASLVRMTEEGGR